MAPGRPRPPGPTTWRRCCSEHLNLAGSADFGYPADPVRIHETGRNVWVKLNLAY